MARQTETALKIIQGGDLRRRFRRKVSGTYQSFAGVVARAQVRDKVGGTLLLDLGPYFSVDSTDNTKLNLVVPAAITAGLTSDGVWDLFFDGQYITGGCVTLHRAVTRP